MSGIESRIDSSSFEAASKKIDRLQFTMEEKFSTIFKDVSRKLDKEEIDKLEKKYFAHVSKIFQSIQKFPDKDEMNKKFAQVDD